MRKIIVSLFFIISFSCCALFSVDFTDEKAVKLMPVYFTADTTAYIGFSDTVIKSVAKPDDYDAGFEFTFNDATGNYETKDIYYFIQAFETGTYNCTITASKKLKQEGVENGVELDYSVAPHDTPDGWSFTDNGAFIMTGSLHIEENKPDFLCGFLVLSVPGETEFDKTFQYSDEIKIECNVIS